MENQANINDKINKYLNGQMSSEEIMIFENEMANDEFLADAIEGYKISGNFPDDLESIRPLIIPEKKNRKLIYGIIYTGVAAALGFAILYIIGSPFENLHQAGKPVSQTIITYPVPEDTITEIDSTEIKPIYIPGEKTYTAELRQLPEKVVVPESIAPLHFNKIIKIDNNINSDKLSEYYRFSSNHLYTYIGSYKVVDFRYDKRMNLSNTEIPSNFTVPEDRSGDLFFSTKEYTYISFLEDALNKIEVKNYEAAIDDFNIILEQYPNDINAVFYKALCLYETNSNKQSMQFFDLALDCRINTFHEESKWYKGLILKEEKQYAAAETVLKEIVNEQGYYGVQAKQELDDLYKYIINE